MCQVLFGVQASPGAPHAITLLKFLAALRITLSRQEMPAQLSVMILPVSLVVASIQRRI